MYSKILILTLNQYAFAKIDVKFNFNNEKITKKLVRNVTNQNNIINIIICNKKLTSN